MASPDPGLPSNAAMLALARAKSRGIGAAGFEGTKRSHPRRHRRTSRNGFASGIQCSVAYTARVTLYFFGRPVT